MDATRERHFLGQQDYQAVIVQNIFSGSPIVVSSGIHLFENRENGITIEGPENHLKFLYPHLLKLVKTSSDSDKFGTWTGVKWADETWLNLYYLFGNSLGDQLELLEHKLRRDIVFLCDLKLSEKAVLMVRNDNKEPLLVKDLKLPEELSANGTIEFPYLIIPVSNILQ